MYTPRSGIAESYRNTVFDILRNSQTVFQRDSTILQFLCFPNFTLGSWACYTFKHHPPIHHMFTEHCVSCRVYQFLHIQVCAYPHVWRVCWKKHCIPTFIVVGNLYNGRLQEWGYNTRMGTQGILAWNRTCRSIEMGESMVVQETPRAVTGDGPQGCKTFGKTSWAQ